MKSLGTVSFFLLALSWHPVATAANIDCSKADNPVEIFICGDSTLMAADQQSNKLNAQLSGSDPSADADQLAWAQQIRNSCASTCSGDDCLSTCLSKAYMDRIDTLEGRIHAASEHAAAEAAKASSQPVKAPATFRTSFNCDQASTDVETLICHSDTLAAADLELEKIVKSKIASDPSFRASQADWLKSTRDQCQTEECLSAAYQARIEALEPPPVATQPTDTFVASEGFPDHVEKIENVTGFDKFNGWQQTAVIILSILFFPIGWFVGYKFGKLGQPNVVFGQAGADLAGKRLGIAVIPFFFGLIGGGVGVGIAFYVVRTYL